MSAQLKPIATTTTRPRFDNTNARLFCLWSRDNYEALKTYYMELGRSLPDDDDGHLEGFAKAQRFLGFCQVQWDRERGVFV